MPLGGLSQFISDQDTRLRLGIYGKPGAGKTWFLGWLPNVVIFDTDRGAEGLKNHPMLKRIGHVPLYKEDFLAGKFNPYEDFTAYLKDAIGKQGDFAPGGKFGNAKSLALDGFTMLAELFADEIGKQRGADPDTTKWSYDEWGFLKKRLGAIADLLKEASKFYNVAATFWIEWVQDRNENPGQTQTNKDGSAKPNPELYRPAPQVMGGFKSAIEYLFNELYYIRAVDVSGNNRERYVHTIPYKKYNAKTRLEADIPAQIKLEENCYKQLSQYWGHTYQGILKAEEVPKEHGK